MVKILVTGSDGDLEKYLERLKLNISLFLKIKKFKYTFQ